MAAEFTMARAIGYISRATKSQRRWTDRCNDVVSRRLTCDAALQMQKLQPHSHRPLYPRYRVSLQGHLEQHAVRGYLSYILFPSLEILFSPTNTPRQAPINAKDH